MTLPPPRIPFLALPEPKPLKRLSRNLQKKIELEIASANETVAVGSGRALSVLKNDRSACTVTTQREANMVEATEGARARDWPVTIVRNAARL